MKNYIFIISLFFNSYLIAAQENLLDQKMLVNDLNNLIAQGDGDSNFLEIKSFIEKNNINLNISHKNSGSPLINAMRKSNAQRMIRLFLKNDANIDATRNQYTPFLYAFSYPNLQNIAELLRQGADIKKIPEHFVPQPEKEITLSSYKAIFKDIAEKWKIKDPEKTELLKIINNHVTPLSELTLEINTD